MGKSCCEKKSSELALLREKQGNVLKIVLLVNAAMFLIEFTYGVITRSVALTADSLDMLGDASVYAFSLYALHRGAQWRARAGYAKGLVMAGFAFLVLGQALYRFLIQTTPEAFTMGSIATLALAANGYCLYLLYSHRSDDVNMRSTWLCSRNDIVANFGVIFSSVLVSYFQSGVPDIVIGTIIALLFFWSSKDVIDDARIELGNLKSSAERSGKFA